MRTKLCLLLLALFALPAGAADLITRWLVITNAPIGNTNSVTLNGSVRTYTNTPSFSPATLIAETNVIGWAATNTANQLTTYRVSFGHQIGVGTNFVSVRGAVGENLTLSINACCFGFITNSTQSVSTPTFVVRVPLTVEAASNQVNIASLLVQGLSTSSTQAFATNSSAISNTLVKGAAAAQYVAGEVQFNNTLRAAANSQLTNANLVNSTNRGYIVALTNGYWTNGILGSPKMTNGENYGLAFRSPGGGTSSEQFGELASAMTNFATAIGNGSVAGWASFAGGYLASAAFSNSVAIGAGAEVTQFDGVAVGQSTSVDAYRGIALGQGAVVSTTHQNSTALGQGSLTTASNQVRVGSTAATVSIPGALEAATIRNAALVGTNTVAGVLAYDPETTVTTVANGHNVIDSSTNAILYITGSPSVDWTLGGFSGAKNDGRQLIVVNQSGFSCTIQNESGTAPTASDRILTYAGAGGVTNVTVLGNGVMVFHYSTTVSRWILRSPSVDVTAYATNVAQTRTLLLKPTGAKLASTNSAFPDTALQTGFLAFPHTNSVGAFVPLSATFDQLILPNDYDTNSLQIELHSMITATNGPNSSNVIWRATVLRHNTSGQTSTNDAQVGPFDAGSSTLTTVWTASPSGTNKVQASLVLITNCTVAAGESFSVKLERLNDNSADVVGGIAGVVAARLKYTTPP